MKKLIPILAAMGLVLAAGLVYADEMTPMAPDLRSKIQDDAFRYVPINGVTFVSEIEPGLQCYGAAAGGMAEVKDIRSLVKDDNFTYSALDNAISFSADIPSVTCSWARGLGMDLVLHNGISVAGGTVDQ